MKQYIKTVAIIMSVVLMLCSVPISISAEESALSVTPITDYTVNHVGCFGNIVTPIDGYSLNGYTVDRTLGWSVDEKNLTKTSSCVLQFNGMSESLSDFWGIMFYVSIPDANTISFSVELEMPESSRWNYSFAPVLLPYVGKEYKYLPNGAGEWQTALLTETYEGNSYRGGMHFDSAFEGYVMLPFSVLKNDMGLSIKKTKDAIDNLVFWFSELGGDYGEVVIGPLFEVTNYSDQTLPQIDEAYRIYGDNKARCITKFTIDTVNTNPQSNMKLTVTESVLPHNTDIPLYYLSGSEYTEYTNETTGTQGKHMLWMRWMDEALYDTEGVLLYVDTPADNIINLDFRLVMPGKERWSLSYQPEMSLYVGNSYYVLPDGTGEWQEKTVVKACVPSWWNSDKDYKYKGGMYFAEAFKGYVKLPYSAFANDSGLKFNTELDHMDSITIRTQKSGGDFGEIGLQAMLFASNNDATDFDIRKAEYFNVSEPVGAVLNVDRKTAAVGERVYVTVTPDNGYTISEKGVTVTYSDFSGKNTLFAEKDSKENTYVFNMPDGENVTIGAEFTNASKTGVTMLNPKVGDGKEIKFKIRCNSTDIQNAGMLIAPYDTLCGKELTREISSLDILDAPCAEMSSEFTSCGTNFGEYTLVYGELSNANLERFFTVRGYVIADGTVIYTDPITVSYDFLKNGYLPKLDSFGEIIGIDGYYLLSTKQINSDCPLGGNGVSISADTVCSKDLTNIQNSKYQFSTGYNGVKLLDYSHISIYLKVPDSGENYLFINIKDSKGTSYRSLAGYDYTLYPKGSNIPLKKTVAEGSNINWGVFVLPSGFEGFLEIPVKNFYPRSSINSNTLLTSIVYRFSNIGTDAQSSPVVGPVFGTVQSDMDNTPVKTLCELENTDSTYCVDTKSTQMTADSALIYFDEVDGAQNYQVCAYKRVMGGYELYEETVLYSNSGAIGNLKEKERYLITVSARDNRDNVLCQFKPFELEYTTDNSISNNIADEQINFDNILSNTLTAEKTFTTLNAAASELLNSNPNRGFRGCMEFYHFNLTDSEIESKIDSYINKFKNNGIDVNTYVCYLYPGDYMTGSLGEEFFTTTQKIFDYLREKNIQILLRFAYYDVNNFNTRTPTTEEILRHISELSENGIISRNSDVLHAFQVGFVGQFGEWHSENEPKADRTAVITAFADSLLPDGVYSQVRMPAYKDFLADTNSKKPLIGFHIDSFFGIMDGTELGSGQYSYKLPQWERQVFEGAYTPNDAELYYWNQFCNMGMYAEGYGSAVAASQLRLTTFSAVNGYLDQSIYSDSCMNYWKKLPVTENWLKYNSLPVSAGWFKNNDGTTVSRNIYEYIRDYLGYRISVKNISVTEDSQDINVNANLVNYGFSAAFNLSSEMVILDSNNNVISASDFGNPEQWYGTGPDNAPDGTLLTHNVVAKLKKPATSGQYKLALRLESKSGATARLDNSIPYENGYNILYEFTY